jgi:hypothetical protein
MGKCCDAAARSAEPAATPASDIDLALLVTSPKVADNARENLMPIEDELKVRITVTALTAQDLAALDAGDIWWSDVVRDARVLKGGRPEGAMKTAMRLVAA